MGCKGTTFFEINIFSCHFLSVKITINYHFVTFCANLLAFCFLFVVITCTIDTICRFQRSYNFPLFRYIIEENYVILQRKQQTLKE